MPTVSKQKGTIVVVDGYSAGTSYPATIRRYGLEPVHVSSGAIERSPHMRELMEEVIQGFDQDYMAVFGGDHDRADLIAQLQDLNPVAVVVGCESGVEFADELSQLLDLPGNVPRLSGARRDKFLMQEALAKAGLRAIKSFKTGNLEELLGWTEQHDSWPVIIKPLRSAATEGVRSCSSQSELRESFEKLIGTDNMFGDANNQVLVQEQVAGKEYIVNTVSKNGRHFLSDMWEYSKLLEPGQPPLYDATRIVRKMDSRLREVVEYGFDVLDALGISFGPGHTEIMLTDEGPVLIESGARPMGGAFPPDIIEKCFGYTQILLVIESYVDPDAFFARFDSEYSPNMTLLHKCLISTREGVVEAVPGISLLSRLKSIQRGDFTKPLESDVIPRTVNLLTSPGLVILGHEDEAVVEHDYALIREMEQKAQNLMFELQSDFEEYSPDRNWFSIIPDELWLKPEEDGKPDGEIIAQALGLQPGEKVLDCPCGDARVGQWLARKGARMTGVDINPRFIDRAKERFQEAGLEAEFLVSDMRWLAYDAEFDAVVNWFNSFGYFGIEDDFLTLTLLARALRPGGRILIETPNREGVIGNVARKYDADGNQLPFFWDDFTERMLIHHQTECDGESQKVVGGVRMYSLEQYRLMFRLTGLEMSQVWGDNLTSFGESSARMIMLGYKLPPEKSAVRLR